MDLNIAFSQMSGVEKRRLVGSRFSDCIPLHPLSDKISASMRNNIEDFALTVHNGRHYEVFILPFASKGLRFVRVYFRDISSFVNLEKELVKRNKELMILNTLSSAFISSENMEFALDSLMTKVLLVADFSIGWLFFKEDGAFRPRCQKGISPVAERDLENGALEALCADIRAAEEPLHLLEPETIARHDFFRKEGIIFVAVVPLIYEKDVIGLLFLASKTREEKYLDFDFAALLSLIGNQVSLIAAKVKMFQETKRLSITDGLTGLFNSRHFYRQLDVEIARTNRYGGSFSLILLDIDNFKQINDNYGHQSGDDILHELAGIFRSVSRETDVVVRYGGEEFIIVLPNTSEEDAIILAERIRKTVESHDFFPGRAGCVRITVSGGLASFPLNASTSRSLLNSADTALYAAKSAGKNRIICYKGKADE